MLRCPVCKKELHQEEKRYACEHNHSFDMAKQGYTNLYLKSSQHSGDNKEMVDARTAFLSCGYYAPLAKALIDMIIDLPYQVVVDAGCGEGYYTNTIQKEFSNQIYAFDLSKEALKIASRNNKNVHYFISSIFDLPIEDDVCDIVLNVFAPLAAKEYHRILKGDGYLIKVDPHRNHLKELKEILYEDVYENEVLDLDIENFSLTTFKEIQFEMNLDQEAIASLFMMTPYYYKTSKVSSDRLKKYASLKCTASFIIYLYKKEKG